MKSTALLATALFLASAPSPDSQTITELTAGFLTPTNVQPLLAATTEEALKKTTSTSLKETVLD